MVDLHLNPLLGTVKLKHAYVSGIIFMPDELHILCMLPHAATTPFCALPQITIML
ncbi:hypothetical protein CY34DRAFT_798784 [Suillus luteus UH-Slu-Lm8-n1]|uniref:Uncharacterized protein n=1 Tax=Suillus luteus UH-Slu-Lm8-n1 TaxID=930992 RepID=A0A0D0B1N9_9AGAM|nr:hypothetical protein CY34DRAFT_798784 [Suillus luteus UH-Slu-Lm8-n1]